MIEVYAQEFRATSQVLLETLTKGEADARAVFQAFIGLYELMRRLFPDEAEYAARLAEFYHLDSHLRRAGEMYRKVLGMVPPEEPTEQDFVNIRRYCPVLLTTPKEYFPLKDVAAVHHPNKPLIGYHLFWEDDYDFPDDYEPCDHEEIWVEYDPEKEIVTNVMTFFHSRVIESKEAVLEARDNGQRPIVRIEWGKHGSLLKGWETMAEPLTNLPLIEWMKQTYDQVKLGGRMADHPLKRFWPKGFEGSFEAYLDFSVPVDPLEWLDRKPLIFKSRWVNAILFTQAIHYNFHPKMEWPDRFSLPTLF
jgi:hypothetical protein